MAEKFGPKYVLITAVGVAGILTILTPYAAINGGFYWMVLSRILQGAAQVFRPCPQIFLSLIIFCFSLYIKKYGSYVSRLHIQIPLHIWN